MAWARLGFVAGFGVGGGAVGSWIRGFVGAVRGFVDPWRVRAFVEGFVDSWVREIVAGFVGSWIGSRAFGVRVGELSTASYCGPLCNGSALKI